MLPRDVHVTVGGDDNLLLRAESKEEPSFPSTKVKVEDEATSAIGTLLRLSACHDSECQTLYVQMKFEEGEWRVIHIDSASKILDLEASVLLRQMQEEESVQSSSPNESSAISALRSINVALVQYQSIYPEIGYPGTLGVLVIGDASEPDSGHAGLLDSSIGCPSSPCSHSGYLFEYSSYTEREGYAARARPEVFGVTGTRSFFTDESGVIRFTVEDRDATEDDPPLS